MSKTTAFENIQVKAASASQLIATVCLKRETGTAGIAASFAIDCVSTHKSAMQVIIVVLQLRVCSSIVICTADHVSLCKS